MATTLNYTVAAYQPFTKILSANINQDKTDIKNRINWAGGTSATTGLGDDNIQSVTASGGGLTRATKLKLGTANYAVYNDGTGALTEAAALPVLSGGSGLSITIGSQQPGDVFQVNATSTAMVLSQPTAVPSSLKVFQFYNFA